MTIPKISHQIWLQGWDKVPDKFKINVSLLGELNPDFVHMKWDEKTLRDECAKVSVAILNKFESFKYLIQKADFGRYVVLYNYGGVSVDTDMKSLKPITDAPGFNNNDFIVSASAFPANMVGWVNNALIMVKKNHPILLDLIMSITESDLKESDFSSKEMYINMTTSPSKFNSIIYKYNTDLLILDYKYFEPCFSVDPVCSPGSFSIMDHKHELSWFNGWVKVLSQFLIVLLYFVIFGLFPFIVVISLMKVARLKSFKINPARFHLKN